VSGRRLARRRAVEVPCTVLVEDSARALRLHVILDGFEIEPGDTVRVHDAPVVPDSGGPRRLRRRATLVRASRLERLSTRLAGLLDLGELCDVGFSSRRFR